MVGQRDEGFDQMVERVNNIIRGREKTLSGLNGDKSAQTIAG